ncbi:MAG TPA: hypothetical protein VM262_12525 [Acidimicrobiales bacterium]|nr:hypothetical protein [Acidimicrobiales bacterium]
MTAVLGAALFGPAVLLVLARLAPTSATARRWLEHGALVLAGLWLVVALGERDATIGRFGAGSAPAGVGTWLLAATATWPTRRSTAALTAVAAAVAVGGVALLGGGGDATDAAGALALAAAVVVLAARTEGDGGLVPAIVCTLGAAAVAFGVAREHDALVLVGAGLATGGSGWRVRRAGVVLLPAAIVLAGVPGAVAWLPVLVLAVVAAALAHRPAVSLGLWAVAAAGVLADAHLLGAAAVVMAVGLHPVLAIAAAPGAAVAVGAAADLSSRWLGVLALLAAITVLRLWRRPEAVVPGPPSYPTAAALALGAWLVLAPETWQGAVALESWGTGVVIAAIAAALGGFLAVSYAEVTFEVIGVEVADPPTPAGDPPWAWRAALAGLAILALSGGALVASISS